MKKFLVYTFLLAFSAQQTSCAAWFQQLQSNPVVALQEAVQDITSVEGMLMSAFTIFAAENPTIITPAIMQQVNSKKVIVDQGIVTIEDGLHVAADAQGPAPNIPALTADAQQALADLSTFIASIIGYTVHPSSSSSPPAATATLHVANTSISRLQNAIDHAAATAHRHY